jgi:hypothetical protein
MTDPELEDLEHDYHVASRAYKRAAADLTRDATPVGTWLLGLSRRLMAELVRRRRQAQEGVIEGEPSV